MITRRTTHVLQNDPSDELELLRVIEGEDQPNPHGIIQRLGGQGHANQPERERWMVAWQVLERAGYICQDLVEPKRWFITPAGRQALSGPLEDSLARRLPDG